MQGMRPMTDIFFLRILCENRLGGNIYHKKEEKTKNRELLKKRIKDGRLFSFGISCQNYDTLSPL